MHYLSSNIRWLRRNAGLTQAALAAKTGCKRAMIGAYEEERAEPRLQTLLAICHYFNISLDDLIRRPLHQDGLLPQKNRPPLRVLPVLVDRASAAERIVLIPHKAAAGYLSGYEDIDYVSGLPHFSLPFPELARERSYRVFQIQGDSMLPLPSGSYIITEYVQRLDDIYDEQCYVVLTADDGLVYKRVCRQEGKDSLLLKSDNPSYEPYEVAGNNILELWRALGYVQFELPGPGSGQLPSQTSWQLLQKIARDVDDIKAGIRT